MSTDRATGYPGICLDIISGHVLWRGFWMRSTLESVDWLKQMALGSVGGPHPIPWRPEKNKRLSLSTWPSWDTGLILIGDLNSNGDLHHWLFRFSGPQTQARTYTISSAGPPACQLQALDFSPPQSREPISYTKSLFLYLYLYLHLYLYLSTYYWLTLEKPD